MKTRRWGLLLALAVALPAAHAQTTKWPDKSVRVVVPSVPALLPHVKAGRVCALGVSTEKRSRELPDLPSISETVPGYKHTSWNGLWAPAGTPKDILTKLNQATGRILSEPDMQQRLRTEGREPAHSTPEEFQRVIARDIAKYSKVVKVGNIKVH